MKNELTIADIILQGMKLGFTNLVSILLATILWILTIWIPYLNVGTTIALFSMPIAMSKGKVMSPTEIFKSKYRHHMGDYFILSGLQAQAILPALMFMIVPAIILSLAWSQSVYLLLDKGVGPAEALTLSNKITDGHKTKIFLGRLVLSVLSFGVFYPFFMFGASAHIYKVLAEDIES